MTLQASRQQISSIKKIIKQKISHDYISKFIKAPTIDEDLILLFINSLNEQEVSKKDAETLIATAMFVNIALDTHEQVSNHHGLLKQRQLTVLAGDYFSGLYYKILAETENIPLIRTLAKGIKAVNEHKVAVYQLQSKDLDCFFHSLQEIESAILRQFCLFFNASTTYLLGKEMLFLKRLQAEKTLFMTVETSILFEAFEKFAVHALPNPRKEEPWDQKKRLLDLCEQYIKHAKTRVDEAMRHIPLPHPLLANRVSELLDDQHVVRTKLYVEEG